MMKMNVAKISVIVACALAMMMLVVCGISQREDRGLLTACRADNGWADYEQDGCEALRWATAAPLTVETNPINRARVSDEVERFNTSVGFELFKVSSPGIVHVDFETPPRSGIDPTNGAVTSHHMNMASRADRAGIRVFDGMYPNPNKIVHELGHVAGLDHDRGIEDSVMDQDRAGGTFTQNDVQTLREAFGQ